MKKLCTFLMTICLILGCSGCFSKKVESITLTLDDKNEYSIHSDIRIFIATEPKVKITADDFSIFGGTISVDGNIATIQYKNPGTYHVRVNKGDVESNEITISIKKKKTSNTQTKTNEQTTTEIKEEPKSKEETEEEKPKKDPNDFTDWENVRDADASKLTSTSDLENTQGQMVLIEGSVPSDGDGSYILTSDGEKIELSGMTLDYYGKVRMYGTYNGNTFNVRSYTAFSNQMIEREQEEEE